MRDCYIIGFGISGGLASKINERIVAALSCHPDGRMCVGTYDGKQEPSFLVRNVSCTDINKQHVLRSLVMTAQSFMQESIFVVHEGKGYLVYSSGRVELLGRVVTSKYPAPRDCDYTYNIVDEEYYYVV